MDEVVLSNFKIQLDSIVNSYTDSIKSICLIHLKNNDAQGKRAIFFDDTLAGYIKGVGFDGFRKPGRKDLVFKHDGALTFDNEKLPVKTGHEYYIVLYTVTGRHQYYYRYKLVDKEHFYYHLL